MGALQTLFSDPAMSIFTVLVLIFAISEIIKAVKTIKDYFGIKTKADTTKDAIDTRVLNLETAQRDLTEKLQTISDTVSKIASDLNTREREYDLIRIKDLKSEILSFARSLKRNVSDGTEDDFDEEDYDHIFEAYRDYECLLDKYNMKNGKTTRAMEIINKYSDIHGYGTEIIK